MKYLFLKFINIFKRKKMIDKSDLHKLRQLSIHTMKLIDQYEDFDPHSPDIKEHLVLKSHLDRVLNDIIEIERKNNTTINPPKSE